MHANCQFLLTSFGQRYFTTDSQVLEVGRTPSRAVFPPHRLWHTADINEKLNPTFVCSQYHIPTPHTYDIVLSAHTVEHVRKPSSNPGDLVADIFCGSGTTPFVAAKHGRSFIACDEKFRALHTTRSRLADLQASFTLERDATLPMQIEPAPRTVKAEISEESICLKSDLDLDYWEVDPAWDGNVFRSAAQARRSIRNGGIPHELKVKAGRNTCIRLVTAEGEQFQLNV